jgi:hypothetical protein
MIYFESDSEERGTRVSKDAGPSVASWFETALARLLTMRITAVGWAKARERRAHHRSASVA